MYNKNLRVTLIVKIKKNNMTNIVTEEGFGSHNYNLAIENVEMYERCMEKETPSLDILIGYSNALIHSGRITDSLNVFHQCLTLSPLPYDKLKYLISNIVKEIIYNTIYNIKQKLQNEFLFNCPKCEGTFYQPVTALCGHTYCRNCYESTNFCYLCGQKLGPINETNVLIQRLVEKWWPKETEASRARHEGDLLLKNGHPVQALDRYNLALQLAPNSPLHLSNRANVLLILNHPQASLADADQAIRLRPDWGKGYYRRGAALCALERYEEAFFALCTSIAIDKNSQNIKNELARIFHKILTSALQNRSGIEVANCEPYNILTENNNCNKRTRGNYRRHHLLRPLINSNRRHQHEIHNSSGCEDDSSSEEEFSQTMSRRLLLNSKSQINAKCHAILNCVYNEIEKLKRVDSMPAEILRPPSSNKAVSLGDLDCILCCRLLWKPVTTPCGHTYCWMCLDRCLDYSSSCPLCVTSLADYLASNQKTVTDFIEKALKTLSPIEYASRAASHHLELIHDIGLLGSKQISVFVCTTAFPCVACPLFVYEPRYRLMVRRCVESGVRHFGITACLNRKATGTKRYAEYGTILEIKDRVLMKDGCSILSTVGGRRFRVLSGGEKDGYDTAQVELISDLRIQEEYSLSLHQLHNKVRLKSKKWWTTVSSSQQLEIQRVFGIMPKLEENWMCLPDGPSWTWWILAILPLGPQLQVGILGTTSLEKRLRAIEKTLSHMEKRQLTITAAPSEDTEISSSICHDDNEIIDTAVSLTHQP